MNKKFNELGSTLHIRSIHLDSNSTIREREQAMQDLQNEGNDLQIICSVDIFSEGIDIPAVSHVVLLRPTQSFCVFLQQLGRGLRKAEDKEYLVALDFVGNFKQSYVAPLAINGYGSTDEYKRLSETQTPQKKLPAGCHISVDTNVQRIWDSEIAALLQPQNRLEFLKAMYFELRTALGCSPSLMDFYRNPAASDPYVFIRQEEFGGNWLRVKHYMGDLLAEDLALLDTPAEYLLQFLEKEIGSSKPDKLIILKFLLNRNAVDWSLDNMTRYIIDSHPDKIQYFLSPEYSLAISEVNDFEKEVVDMCRVVKEGPLKALAQIVFESPEEANRLRLKEEYIDYWTHPAFVRLASDIVEFGLIRYFSMRKPDNALKSTLRGYYVHVSYATQRSQLTLDIVKAVSNNLDAQEWIHEFRAGGYKGKMDIEIFNDRFFTAWTPVKYDDLTRFPARIKAAATALYRCGQRGQFHIEANDNQILISRI